MHLTHTGIQNSLSRHFSCDNCSTNCRNSNITLTTKTQSTTTARPPKADPTSTLPSKPLSTSAGYSTDSEPSRKIPPRVNASRVFHQLTLYGT
ncbi:hypothetical protein DPMN_001677 [Dreissena polymorpha]|uniref:Uncharacterized protein n=1 Tax=Dreissena polymorpha TaxID=45954 RepID=A0A9D4RR22_DREPO|nr:hypothetical protein DPMN_001677 [Dreissena polymorpha]